jgi:hypothetical protein
MKLLLVCLAAMFSFCASTAWGQDRGSGRSVVRPDIAPRPPRINYPWSPPATQPIIRPAVQPRINTTAQPLVHTTVQPRTHVTVQPRVYPRVYPRNEIRNHCFSRGFYHPVPYRGYYRHHNYCATTTSYSYTKPVYRPAYYAGSSYFATQTTRPAIVVIQKPAEIYRPIIVPPPVIYEKEEVKGQPEEEKVDTDCHIRVKVKTYRGKISSINIEKGPVSADGKVTIKVKVNYR